MLVSVIDDIRSAPSYPEIAGRRVLITGLTSSFGVDIARAFAEHQARLVLQLDETTEEMQAVAEMLAPAAEDIRMFAGPRIGTDEVVRLARSAVTAFGGLEVVINLVPLSAEGLSANSSVKDIEASVAGRLLMACLVSRIVANRMRLTYTDGLILNVAALAPDAGAADRAYAAVAKSALAAMTRFDAREWESQGLRFNAIGPQCAGEPAETGALVGEAEIAALALYLASGRGKSLSGYVFEAEAAKAV